MLPCRATPRTREKQRAPGPRHQPRTTKVWNQPGSRERNRKEGPHPCTSLFAEGVQRHHEKQEGKGSVYGKRDISTPWYGAKGEERAHTRRHKCEGRYVIRRGAATNMVSTMHEGGPHTPTLPSVSQGATREKAGEEKDRDTHQGGGREKVHARERGEQREGKRATTPRTKQGVASSRARDARRGGGTAGTRHTADTTLNRSTGEESTRGTREKRHHAPRHAPHRHHTHRRQPHLRPQHVASELRQPAQRAGSRGRGSA